MNLVLRWPIFVLTKKKSSKFLLYVNRRVYLYLRVSKRLLTEQLRQEKKIKFFGMYQTPASETKAKENKTLRKLQQKQKK